MTPGASRKCDQNLHIRQELQPGRLFLEEAKRIRRWGNQSQGITTAKQVESYCQRVDRDMSSRREIGREQSWER
jgi:hypothetical protein